MTKHNLTQPTLRLHVHMSVRSWEQVCNVITSRIYFYIVLTVTCYSLWIGEGWVCI